jgi:predicted small lipoprotein YifL
MKAILTRLVAFATILIAGTVLFGCGNKGPLVPPKAEQRVIAPAITIEASEPC